MTAQANNLATRLRAALKALAGSAPEDMRNHVAELELDLRQKDAEIASLREEYERLHQQGERERNSAASAGFDALARRLAPLLSQLATMQSLADSGKTPRVEDVLKLAGMLERMLTESGLTRIGAVGEEIAFDTRLHQCMSGDDIEDSERIRVRFVGYRHGENILLKAMVSRVDAASGKEAEKTEKTT